MDRRDPSAASAPAMSALDKRLEAFAAVTGIAGALLLALSLPGSRYAWFFYLASTTSWLIFAIRMKFRSMIGMNVGYGIINIVGICRSFL